MTHEEIQKLGFLARINVSDEEAAIFAKDITNILGFLKQVESVDVGSDIPPTHRFVNIVREDAQPYEAGKFSEKILREAPDTQDGFIKVKKIL